MFIYFQSEYRRLSDSCKNYGVELLDLCQSTEEIVSILNEGSDAESDDEAADDIPHTANVTHSLARVKLALKYEQKRVSLIVLPGSNWLLNMNRNG